MSSKKEIELDSKLMELDVLNKKARVVCNDLYNTCFNRADPEPWVLRACYEDGELRISIVMEFLHDMNRLIQELQRLINKPESSQEGKQVD